MKTLDQIQPRTPISSLPITISTSGSYYLTQSLSVSSGNGISISASGVTLDLNGFSISSTAASLSGSGVAVNAHDVTIKNGSILGGVTYNGTSYSTGPGFLNGISSFLAYNVLVSDVTVSGCGGGIVLQPSGGNAVQRCLVNTVSSQGIAADAVRESSARVCGSTGITAGSMVITSIGDSTGGGGISAPGAIVQNSSGFSTGGNTGISGSIVIGSFGQTATGTGIVGTTTNFSRGTATGNGTGISAARALSCIGDSSGGTGISATWSLP
jgi:hypothetical protein